MGALGAHHAPSPRGSPHGTPPLKALQGKSAAVTQRVGKEILKLSGFTEDAVPDVESAEKN